MLGSANNCRLITLRFLTSQKVEAAIGGAPAVSDGRVYIVARDDAAWAVRAADGKVDAALRQRLLGAAEHGLDELDARLGPLAAEGEFAGRMSSLSVVST